MSKEAKAKESKAAQFEEWKRQEVQRISKIHQEEQQLFEEKLMKEWMNIQTKTQKSWDEKQNQIEAAMTDMQNDARQYSEAVSTKKNLEKEIASLEKELDRLRKPVEDNSREERLVRISTLKVEIQNLEEQCTAKEREYNEMVQKKERYKRLYLEANKTLNEIRSSKKLAKKKAKKQ